MPKITTFIWPEPKGYWTVRGIMHLGLDCGPAIGHWVSFNDVVWC